VVAHKRADLPRGKVRRQGEWNERNDIRALKITADKIALCGVVSPHDVERVQDG